MKNPFIQHLMKENIGIGPIDNVTEYSDVISSLHYHRISIRQVSWELACEMPSANFALILDTNSLVFDVANQANKYITPAQYIANINEEGNWNLN